MLDALNGMLDRPVSTLALWGAPFQVARRGQVESCTLTLLYIFQSVGRGGGLKASRNPRP